MGAERKEVDEGEWRTSGLPSYVPFAFCLKIELPLKGKTFCFRTGSWKHQSEQTACNLPEFSMFIIVALVYKSSSSVCENLIAAFKGKGSRKTFFWVYTRAERRIWFRALARVRSRVVSPCGCFKKSSPQEKTNGGNREVSLRESEVLAGSSCGLQLLRKRIYQLAGKKIPHLMVW